MRNRLFNQYKGESWIEPELDPNHPWTDRLQGFYAFEEGGGPKAYDPAGRHHGTLNSLTWSRDAVGGYLSGFLGGTTTSTTYVDCGASAALNPTAAISLLAWIYPTTIGPGAANYVVARDHNTGGRSFAFGISSSSNVRLDVGGPVVLDAGGGIVANAWQCISCSGVSGGTYTGYLNGKQVSSATGGALNVATGATNIGRRSFTNSNLGYIGRIHLVAIWSRVLTAAEHAEIGAHINAIRQVYRPRRRPTWRLIRTLFADGGAFVEAGQAAGLVVARKLTATTGSFTETGVAAGLIVARVLVASAGTFAETGVAAGLSATRILVATTGTFAESGQAAALLRARVLVASAGTFIETGQAAALLHGLVLVAATGSFVETGHAAGLVSSGRRDLAADTGVFAAAGFDAGLFVGRLLVAARGKFKMRGVSVALLTSQVYVSSLPAQTTPVYATDEDVAVRAGTDYIVLAPTSQVMASGSDGVFEEDAPWVLTSPSISFEDQGVLPNHVVHFTEPRTVFRGGGNLLAVESVSGNEIVLRRLHKGLHVGQPPAPNIGVTGVHFTINTLDPQIEEATFDIKRRFGIDEAIALRGSSSIYDLRDLRMATVLQVMLNRYTQESRTEHGDFDMKVDRIRAELENVEGRMSVRWGKFGNDSAPSSVFGTKLLRG